MKYARLFISLLVGILMVLGLVVLATSRQALPTSAASATDTAVDVWLTTGDESHKWDHQIKHFIPGSGSCSLHIWVDANTKYQQMDGFGAALTDSSAWLIDGLEEVQRNNLLEDLFTRQNNGIGISYIRLPMGASEFVTGTHYTYDDLPLGLTDTHLISFSIAHDQAYIIPLLQQAKSLNPQLKVMASPWSAPAWMKTTGTLTGGGSLITQCYEVYANYFVSFTQAYESEGIPIHAVTIQNEPHYTDTTYPTMWMEWSEQADFVKHYLGPAFGRAGFTSTKILVWDHNWNEPGYPINILNDSEARAYIAGSAWHCYACIPHAQTVVHEAHPDKDIYFTECTGSLATDFGNDLVWNFQNLFIGVVRNWAKTVLLWNLALDENGHPHEGGCNNCRGVVTITQPGTITYNVEYYALGHLSKFVDPGAYRIASDQYPEQLESVAFQNPDGSIVLVVLNPRAVDQSFDVQWGDTYFSHDLPAQSVATFKWSVHRIYAPLVLRAYRAPLSFQDFEPDNGTPGDYFQDVWFMTCVFDSAIIRRGRSIRCHAHAEADAPDSDPSPSGGTVGISASSSVPIDLSSATTISVWVYDTQGNNTVQLRLYDEDGIVSHAIWSEDEEEEKTCKMNWAQITWPLSAFCCVDMSRITGIQVYLYNDGIYYFDDVAWQ